MSLYHKVRAVEGIFHQLEKEVASFQLATGMACLAGCGRCCQYPDIAATSLEFLPLAYHLFKLGEAEAWYERLQAQQGHPICCNFKPLLLPGDKGFCQQYAHRGLICRLFGFAASLDKHGQAIISACKPLKTEAPAQVSKAKEYIAEGNPVPILRNYYFQLRAIDPDLGSKLSPINQAIQEALGTVLAYYTYRRRPRRKAG